MAMRRTDSPTPSSPAQSTSSLSPGRVLSARTQRSRNGTANVVERSSSLVRSDSSKKSERSHFRTDSAAENYRQDSIDPNASIRSLYEYRNGTVSFHWEDSEDSFKEFRSDERFPLEHVAKLSDTHKAKALVWASKITVNKHGFTDTVADKIVRYNTPEEKLAARTEVENLKKLCHNHIVAFLGYYIKGGHLGILTFPVAAWDLDYFLQVAFYDAEMRREMIRPWFGCLTRVLIFLHTREMPIKHRDIKPANILIDRSGAVCLTDFGISKEYPNAQATVTRGDGRFTVKYAAPQMVGKSEQGVESDIFSLGCVFLEMATVLLGKDLVDNMYTFINPGTGPESREIEYHRDFGKLSRWADELQCFVLSQNRATEWELNLARDGLPMILRMVTDSCDKERGINLEEVCKKLDPISFGCHSCGHKVPTDTVTDGELKVFPKSVSGLLIGENPVTEEDRSPAERDQCVSSGPGSAGATPLKQHLRTRQSNIKSTPAVPEATEMSLRTVLHDPEASQGNTSHPPSIILQRRASNLSNYDLAETPLPPQQLRSIDEGLSTSVTDEISSTVTPNSPDPTDNLIKPNSVNLAEKSPKHDNHRRTGEQPDASVSPSIHKSTEPTSVMNNDNKIHMVDNLRTRTQIKSFEDARSIPGTEVLFFDNDKKRWQVTQKSNIRLREGYLWKLPRGIKIKYDAPGGYFKPWGLPPRENMKRIFGKSMRTMFIPERKTASQLAAIYSHEDYKIS